MKKLFTISLIAAGFFILLISLVGLPKIVTKWTAAKKVEGKKKRGIVRRPTGLEFQKGMCYTSWNKAAYGTEQSDESLAKIKEINTGWVAILTTWQQENCFSTKIFPTAKSPTDENFKHAIEKAHSLGMKVMVKPHLDILDTEEGSWRGEISPMRESDWSAWFESYKDFILHYAKIAEETNCEMLCIGTELTSTTATNTKKWRKIIKEIRKVYKGDLTYAANWSEEYLQIRFWDALDYAGIDAYFPLSKEDKPTYEELLEAWKPWFAEIEEWQAGIRKPIIFPEVGYRSSLGSARHPWEHEPGPKPDMELQVDCYKALVDTFWDKNWFYGVYWWDWGTNVNMGGEMNRGFTPQNKPVQKYIKELYSKEITR